MKKFLSMTLAVLMVPGWPAIGGVAFSTICAKLKNLSDNPHPKMGNQSPRCRIRFYLEKVICDHISLRTHSLVIHPRLGKDVRKKNKTRYEAMNVVKRLTPYSGLKVLISGGSSGYRRSNCRCLYRDWGEGARL